MAHSVGVPNVTQSLQAENAATRRTSAREICRLLTPLSNVTTRPDRPVYFQSLAEAIRDPDELLALLGLPASLGESAQQAARQFPLLVPRSFLARMEPGNPHDPLLRQVLPIQSESMSSPDFTADPVGDLAAGRGAGLIQKYEGRALLIATGACAVHCRYCFRRHFPYADDPAHAEDWRSVLQTLADDDSIREIILSGGDPLMLTDERLGLLIDRLGAIPHLKRLRIHTRLPIVLPDRVTPRLLEILRSTRLAPVIVVHANHPNELVGDCAEALRHLKEGSCADVGPGKAGRMTLLNQAVLLRGVNDDADVLEALSERLFELGILPYYLHQLDRVAGAAHFEVSEKQGRALMEQLRSRLPGYLVPQYVRETKGKPSKTPII